MSAFVVGPEHIGLLVWAASRPGRHHEGPLRWYSSTWGEGRRPELVYRTEEETAAMLHLANVESVCHRYEDSSMDDLPGPCDYDHRIPYPYIRPRLLWERYPEERGKPPTPVLVLKAISCYEYQACEHPGWRTSEAREFCERLRARMISELPGYDDAPGWEYSGREGQFAA